MITRMFREGTRRDSHPRVVAEYDDRPPESFHREWFGSLVYGYVHYGHHIVNGRDYRPEIEYYLREFHPWRTAAAAVHPRNIWQILRSAWRG